MKSYLKWIGRVLVLLSLFFVFKKLGEYKDEIIQTTESGSVWLFVLTFVVLYSLLKFIHSYGWYSLLLTGREELRGISSINAIIVFGKTHIAKYIPGNVFHYTGRHIFAREYDLSDSYLIKTTILEITIVVSIAILFSLFSLKATFSLLYGYLPVLEYLPTIIGVISMVSVLVLTIYLWRDKIRDLIDSVHFYRLIKTYIIYLLFFVINLIFFFGVLIVLKGELMMEASEIFQIIGGYSTAWVLGFVVPGAPGGIGVREVVLLALLESSIAESTLLVAIILFRVVTLGGDFLHFILTYMLEYTIE